MLFHKRQIKDRIRIKSDKYGEIVSSGKIDDLKSLLEKETDMKTLSLLGLDNENDQNVNLSVNNVYSQSSHRSRSRDRNRHSHEDRKSRGRDGYDHDKNSYQSDHDDYRISDLSDSEYSIFSSLLKLKSKNANVENGYLKIRRRDIPNAFRGSSSDYMLKDDYNALKNEIISFIKHQNYAKNSKGSKKQDRKHSKDRNSHHDRNNHRSSDKKYRDRSSGSKGSRQKSRERNDSPNSSSRKKSRDRSHSRHSRKSSNSPKRKPERDRSYSSDNSHSRNSSSDSRTDSKRDREHEFNQINIDSTNLYGSTFFDAEGNYSLDYDRKVTDENGLVNKMLGL